MRLADLLSEVPELLSLTSAGRVRLPELIQVPFTPRVRAVVDHPHMQRLRSVRQLSLSYFVFPGAVHTRFEHSLGVFETAARYLLALTSHPKNEEFTRSLTLRDVESFLLAALLHDIGHYPFAHVLEDLDGEIPDHIGLLRPMLTGAIGEIYPSLKLSPATPPLGEVILRHWRSASIDDIAYYVSGELSEDRPGVGTEVRPLLRSLLDGPVDADKMDYLYRDSIHCGVPYGRFIDRDRFFSALTVASGTTPRLALTGKGRIGMELLAYARSAMYSEVYWHHASRAITVMLNAALKEALSVAFRGDRLRLMDLLFGRSDEEALGDLGREGGSVCADLVELIRQRRLYKRLAVVQSGVHPTLFDMLDRLKWEERDRFMNLQTRFVERIQAQRLFASVWESPIPWHWVLVDVPARKKGLSDVPILSGPDGGTLTGALPDGVWHGIRHDFEQHVRKIRVMCHPDLAQALETKGRRTSFNDTLLNLLSECAWEELTRFAT